MADFDCIEKPYKCKCIGPAVVCMALTLGFKDTIFVAIHDISLVRIFFVK